MSHPDEVSDRMRALRVALKLTQEQFADRAGLSRTDYARVENGHNKATSYAMRKSLAVGAGLSLDDVVALLDGKLSVDDALARSVNGIAQTGTG